MKPPYQINESMLHLCTEISALLGRGEGLDLLKPQPSLRKANRIRTIQGSLSIEGNTLSLEQVTSIIDGKRVAGSKKEVREVVNAVRAYDRISEFKPLVVKSLLQAHGILMNEIIVDAGKWRTSNVGVFKGSKVAHTAPQAKMVAGLMAELFRFLNEEKGCHALIRSAIFHYELEFIHPFSDGNGRIGRLWQTVLLANYHPLFEFTPVESVIRERQNEYYEALGRSDKEGSANAFIEFSLAAIYEALKSLIDDVRPVPLLYSDRIAIAREKFKKKEFTRKEYLRIFKTISTATASRDLAAGVKEKKLGKSGDKRLAVYRFR